MISYLFIFELNLYYNIRIPTINKIFVVKNTKC